MPKAKLAILVPAWDKASFNGDSVRELHVGLTGKIVRHGDPSFAALGTNAEDCRGIVAKVVAWFAPDACLLDRVSGKIDVVLARCRLFLPSPICVLVDVG